MFNKTGIPKYSETANGGFREKHIHTEHLRATASQTGESANTLYRVLHETRDITTPFTDHLKFQE